MTDRKHEHDLTGPTPQEEQAAIEALNEGEVVEETDVPSHPDEKTQAESEAAYDAIHYTRPDRRKYRGPKSIAILLLVVAGVVGLGIYAVVWSDNMRQKNEKIQLRKLEERHVMWTWQQKNAELKQKWTPMPDIQIVPANSLYEPLNPSEKARYDALLAQYGSQFEPDENEKALIAETEKLLGQIPKTQPATKPG